MNETLNTPNPTTQITRVSPEIQALAVQNLSRIGTIASAILAIVFLIAAIINPFWQLFIISAAFSITFLSNVLQINVFKEISEKRKLPQNTIQNGLFNFSLLLMGLLIEGIGLPISIIIILYAIILSSVNNEQQNTDAGFVQGFSIAIITAVGSSLTPFEQVSIPAFQVYIPALLGILAMMFITLLTMEFISASLRIRLITGSLAIAILPLILLSLIESRFIQNSLQAQTNQALSLAASQTANRIDEFVSTNKSSIASEASLPAIVNYLLLEPEKRKDSPEEAALILTLQSFLTKQKNSLYSYGVLDANGINIYDTDLQYLGWDESRNLFFSEPFQTGQVYASPVLFFSENSDAFLYFSSPIRNERQQIIGVLRVRYDAAILQTMLEEYTNLIGERSYPILLDENYVRLADTITPHFIYHSIIPLGDSKIRELQRDRRMPNKTADQLTTYLPEFAAGIENINKTPFFLTDVNPGAKNTRLESAAVAPLLNQEWYVVFLKEQTALQLLLEQQNRLSSLISTLIAGLVGLFTLVIARAVSNPIINLRDTAVRISSGDFEAQAVTETNDEIGTLGQAFNIMTRQLRTLINELEDRVNQRTQALALQNETLTYRSRQLQTVADVARGVATVQDLKALLETITILISERFGFYHVGIFLLDENLEFAVLRAANSEGGKRMLARQHKLRVGQVGIVGFVTGRGEPRITTDTGQDAVYYNNPDLPLTRSEMAIPLKVGDKIIGALDVQSTISNAFSQEDVDLFSTLADQVAIALENNRLFTETAQALEESRQLHRQYLRQEWTAETRERLYSSYLYTPSGIVPVNEVTNPEIQQSLSTGETIAISSPAERIKSRPATMTVPIQLRGETIGVIHLEEKTAEGREWSEDDIETIQTVADQVGLALENARLLERTIRRAERERKVYEITSKIRSTNDPQEMLQIAISELQSTLKASRAQIILQFPQSQVIKEKSNGNGNHPDMEEYTGGMDDNHHLTNQ